MSAELITLPFRPVINTKGVLEPGALLDVFQSGTTTRISVYSDEAMTNLLPNPVVADGSGTFPPVYYDVPATIRVRVRRADGSLFPNADFDPYSPTAINLATDTFGSIPINRGGTGAVTADSALTSLGGTTVGVSLFKAASAAAARTALGATTLGGNLLTVGNPSAVTFLRVNADNTVSALDAATFRTAIGAGTGNGNGTVTSVSGTGTVSGLTLSGTVTGTGNLTLGGTLSVTSSNVSDFAAAVRAQVEAALIAGSNVTISPSGTGATRQLTVASTGGGGGTTPGGSTGQVQFNSSGLFAGASGLVWDSALSRLNVTGAVLGGTTGNSTVSFSLNVPNTVNTQRVIFSENRASTGTDWTTTRSRVTTRVDTADMTYIDLRTDGAAPGIAFGTGSGGTPTERMRITQTGDVGIGTGSPNRRFTVSTTAAFNAVQFNSAFSLSPSTLDTGEVFAIAGNSAVSGLTFSAGDSRLMTFGASPQNRAFVRARSFDITTDAEMVFTTTSVERMRITAGGTVAVGSDGTDFGRTWRFVANQLQNAQTNYGFINSDSGAAAAVNVSRITGVGNSFCDWALSNNGGSPVDGFNYGSAVTAVRWSFASNIRFTLNSDGSITSADRADAVGYKGLPVNAQTTGYTLVLADQGRMVTVTGNMTIPANASVAFPVGTTITVYNNSAANISIAITTDTLRLSGSATTGTRTLAQRGFATLVKVAATEWVATGNVS